MRDSNLEFRVVDPGAHAWAFEFWVRGYNFIGKWSIRATRATHALD